MGQPQWQWDEMVQRGTDYECVEEVRAYDERMSSIRGVAAESARILGLLGVSRDDVLLEIGTGTGAFACEAAKRCAAVIAIDVSQPMLDFAAGRAREERITNISFKRAGFLTYDHDGTPLAAAVSQLALHHLPDAWKLVALRHLAGMMACNGRLYLTDVVFPDSAQNDWAGYVERILGSMPAGIREEMALHVRAEYSTFDWIMRGILERAGFAIGSAEMEGDFLARYLCVVRGQ